MNLTDEARREVERAIKLMTLAGKNENENEAAAATAKAMAILERWNLDLAVLGEDIEGGRRSEEKLHGGFYEYEQSVWRYVADLNFCLYWNQGTWVKRERMDAKAMRIKSRWRRENILRRQHRLVGRTVNVQATIAMATYLLGAIERLTRDRLRETWGAERINTQMRSRWAVSYREGIAERVVEKLWARREEIEKAETQAQREAEARAAMAGVSDSTTLTIASIRKSERDANRDFLYGEGFSAREAAAVAKAAQRRAEEEAAYTAWAAEHPEEAARKEAEERAKRRRQSYRAPREKERDWSAYKSGYSAGESVGIDPQADRPRSSGGIGHTAGRLEHRDVH